MNGRARAFQAEGTAWTSVFLVRVECPVSETAWGRDRIPRTQGPAKPPGLSPMVSELALLPSPAPDTPSWLWKLGQRLHLRSIAQRLQGKRQFQALPRHSKAQSRADREGRRGTKGAVAQAQAVVPAP